MRIKSFESVIWVIFSSDWVKSTILKFSSRMIEAFSSFIWFFWLCISDFIGFFEVQQPIFIELLLKVIE